VEKKTASLGKLSASYGVAPAYLQRAAIVAVLSFMFFLAMLFAFYLRQHFGYFLLSTAFLIVYIFTMIGWWMQRRNVVKIHSRGISYRKWSAEWNDRTGIERTRSGLELTDRANDSVTIGNSINGLEGIEAIIRAKRES
jgi:hypothetical protein